MRLVCLPRFRRRWIVQPITRCRAASEVHGEILRTESEVLPAFDRLQSLRMNLLLNVEFKLFVLSLVFLKPLLFDLPSRLLMVAADLLHLLPKVFHPAISRLQKLLKVVSELQAAFADGFQLFNRSTEH